MRDLYSHNDVVDPFLTVVGCCLLYLVNRMIHSRCDDLLQSKRANVYGMYYTEVLSVLSTLDLGELSTFDVLSPASGMIHCWGMIHWWGDDPFLSGWSTYEGGIIYIQRVDLGTKRWSTAEGMIHFYRDDPSVYMYMDDTLVLRWSTL